MIAKSEKMNIKIAHHSQIAQIARFLYYLSLPLMVSPAVFFKNQSFPDPNFWKFHFSPSERGKGCTMLFFEYILKMV